MPANPAPSRPASCDFPRRPGRSSRATPALLGLSPPVPPYVYSLLSCFLPPPPPYPRLPAPISPTRHARLALHRSSPSPRCRYLRHYRTQSPPARSPTGPERILSRVRCRPEALSLEGVRRMAADIRCAITGCFSSDVASGSSPLAGDLIYIRIFGNPILVINSAKAAADLLDKRSSIYSSRPYRTMVSELYVVCVIWAERQFDASLEWAGAGSSLQYLMVLGGSSTGHSSTNTLIRPPHQTTTPFNTKRLVSCCTTFLQRPTTCLTTFGGWCCHYPTHFPVCSLISFIEPLRL